MKLLAPLCVAMLAGAPATAQDFNVTLGGKVLGQLSYRENGGQAILSSTLNNTPMGVFNGTFEGTSKSGTFTGDSASSRKQRRVIVGIKEGRAHSTQITPAEEQTDLSEPAKVPSGVMDPVRIIGALLESDGCPKTMRLYDGRRVVAMTPTAKQQVDNALTCAMSYKVIAGPGHLSPLRIAKAKMQMTYALSEGEQHLVEIKVSSGIFNLNLNRSK